MKSTPTVPAASSIARASSTGSPFAPSVSSETGVIEMRLLATRMPNSSPISSTVFTSRDATRRIFSAARPAIADIESLLQSSRFRPSVTVRTSRCSISVMATVCRISAWVYSIRLADHLADNQQHEEQHKQHGRDEYEAQARIVRGLIDHNARDVANVFQASSYTGGMRSGRQVVKRSFRDSGAGRFAVGKLGNFVVAERLPALRTKHRGLAERDSTVMTASGDFWLRHRRLRDSYTRCIALK